MPKQVTVEYSLNKHIQKMIENFNGSEELRKAQMMIDYYNNRQIADYDKCLEIYNADFNAASHDPYQIFWKLMPMRAELEDGKKGKGRWLRRNPMTFPFTSKVIDALGCLYTRPPARHFESTPLIQKELEDWAKEIQIDAYFMNMERFSYLNGVCGILFDYIEKHDPDPNQIANYHPDESLVRKGNIVPSLITRNMFEIVENPQTGKADAVIIRYARPSNADPLRPSFFYRVYTNDKIYLYGYPESENGSTVSGQPQVLKTYDNDIGAIPIVWMNDVYPTLDFWGRGIGEPLCRANLKLNLYMSLSEELAKYRSQGLWVAINWDTEQPLSMEPNVINQAFTMTDKSEIRDISPSGDMSKITQSASTLIVGTLGSLNLPTNLFSLDQSSSAPAIVEQNQALRNFALAAQPKCEAMERRFWNMYLKVKATYENAKYKDEVKVVLTWKRWPKAGADNEREFHRFALFENLDKGIILESPVDFFMEYYDMQESEAIAKWEECQKDAKKLKQLQLDIEALANPPPAQTQGGSGDATGSGNTGNASNTGDQLNPGTVVNGQPSTGLVDQGSPTVA